VPLSRVRNLIFKMGSNQFEQIFNRIVEMMKLVGNAFHAGSIFCRQPDRPLFNQQCRLLAQLALSQKIGFENR